jgi:hypothetical protein
VVAAALERADETLLVADLVLELGRADAMKLTRCESLPPKP